MTDPADWERDFAAYVDGRGRALRGTAYLLCGDWHHAEDLTQAALTKLYLAWRRIDRAGSVDAYARKVLLRAFLDERRRPWRREHPAAEPPEVAPRAGAPDGAAGVDERLALLAALRRLPPGQRAVVVLRHWEDLDVRQTAAALGISEGSVKSASSRGLAALRGVLRDDARPDRAGPGPDGPAGVAGPAGVGSIGPTGVAVDGPAGVGSIGPAGVGSDGPAGERPAGTGRGTA